MKLPVLFAWPSTDMFSASFDDSVIEEVKLILKEESSRKPIVKQETLVDLDFGFAPSDIIGEVESFDPSTNQATVRYLNVYRQDEKDLVLVPLFRASYDLDPNLKHITIYDPIELLGFKLIDMNTYKNIMH